MGERGQEKMNHIDDRQKKGIKIDSFHARVRVIRHLKIPQIDLYGIENRSFERLGF